MLMAVQYNLMYQLTFIRAIIQKVIDEKRKNGVYFRVSVLSI